MMLLVEKLLHFNPLDVVNEGDPEEEQMNRFFDFLREWVEGHLFHSVQRSLCGVHFQEFQVFHDGLAEVAQEVTLGTSTAADHILTFFPPHPNKVGRSNWIQFENWLAYGLGSHVKNTCLSWCRYGRTSIWHCLDWRNASRVPAPNGEPADFPANPVWYFGEIDAK
ncbi:hypothetical protein FRX31_020077 [Thalictrum thalictroides]|uniref:Uncharacterized protein n=1 Tax=Thalictrum thalictroides TaxID=46969 RepID=A0A7J6W1Y1_THATH|nr:hypothetical protein FRX31_020077 [Thalictrum thalictroides]